MTSAKEYCPEISNRAVWQGLTPLLERAAIGPPAGRKGTFPGTVFTICKLLEGSVHMERQGSKISASSGDKLWILCTPGIRTQHFSDDASIVSIHLALDNPGNGAEWFGKKIACVRPDTKAERALHKLSDSPILSSLPRSQRLALLPMALELEEQMELQILTINLFLNTVRMAAQNGMFYGVPVLKDPRVRNSHRFLAGLDVRRSFSREQLARQEGLTPGQLERLWRRELGESPTEFRDRQKLEFACQQLRTRQTPIKVIAAELGFRHLSQFSNWFHLRQGESPRRFRLASVSG